MHWWPPDAVHASCQANGGVSGARPSLSPRTTSRSVGEDSSFLEQASTLSGAFDAWPGCPNPRRGRLAAGRPTDVATSVAAGRGTGRRVTVQNAKSPAAQGLSMRRRGLEPPPGYPGPGPQPGNSVVISVRIAPDRPYRPALRTIRTHRTIRMLPRMLPRAGTVGCAWRRGEPFGRSARVRRVPSRRRPMGDTATRGC